MAGDSRSRPVADGGIHRGALFEAFPDPLLAYAGETDPDGGDGSPVVRGVNPAFEAAFDPGADELAGSPLDGVALAGTVAPEHDDANGGADSSERGGDASDPPATTTAGSLLGRVRDAGIAVRFSHGTDDGTRHFRVRAITTGTADGGEQGCLLFTDVTELERGRRDLAGTVARLERLASVASHDLRNPLEVAEIRLEAARDTGDDVHFEKVAGALDRIERIVQDVLAVGGGDVDPTDTVALADVAEGAWETVDTADAELVTPRGLPTVRGDADRLRGMFENLFRNAVDHGGPDVTVAVEPIPGGFAVVDDGPGIPEEIRDRVFETGYSTAPNNSGLGLSIVGRIAREHGWQVSFEPGRETSTGADGGARFEFTGVERVDGGDGASEPDGP